MKTIKSLKRELLYFNSMEVVKLQEVRPPTKHNILQIMQEIVTAKGGNITIFYITKSKRWMEITDCVTTRVRYREPVPF